MPTELLDELKESEIDLPKLINDAIAKIEGLLKIGYSKEAEAIAKQLLVVDPDNITALQLYGLILYREGKYNESIAILEKAIKIDNSNCENHNNIALSYLHSGQSATALESIQRAIELSPNNFNFVSNLGLIQRASGNLDAAIESFLDAIDLNPNDSRNWENLGSAYGQNKKLDLAIQCFQKAIELDPKNLGAHIDLAYSYHLNGEWAKGWSEYEYRLEYWHQTGRGPGKFYELYKPEKTWDGKASLQGKSIVVFCEQGMGDQIHFVRFVPKLKELGATVLLDIPAPLASLFESFGEVRTSHGTSDYDYHCSILSLPLLLGMTTPDKFMSDKPYLFVDESLDMTEYQGLFKIGIVWAGNPGHPNDANRSCALSNFRAISQLPNVKLFSLQKELGKRAYASAPGLEIDLAAGCEDMSLVDMSEFMVDYKATAKIINSMDLIITVDTSVLHLAAALGKPTWALIPYNPDWRWTIKGDKTVWYDCVALFRQPENNWTSVFDSVYRSLNESLLSNK